MESERIYLTFNYPEAAPGDKTLLTGIRQKHHIYYISGFYVPSDGPIISFVYKGNLTGITGPCSDNSWNILTYPSITNRTVVNTELYGPDIRKHNNIRVVGNYTTEETENRTIGAMYEGKLNGFGVWTTLTPPNAINTIAHSTMKDLVVGNYETTSILGKAFVYDVKNKTYFDIIKPRAKTITAYGIWYNGNKKYTICGGYSNLDIVSGVDTGYIVDYDNKKHILYNWREYHYNNDPSSIITHFDGISGNECNGYTLTGTGLITTNSGSENCAFFARVERKCNGEFSHAKWERLIFPGSDSTTGNSITKTTVIGIYTLPYEVEGTTNGYISILI